MRPAIRLVFVLLTVTLTCFAQQTPQPYSVRAPRSSQEKPSTKNYQLELQIKRGDKTARYLMTLNGGSVSTELLDKFIEQKELSEPRTISFQAALTEFEGEGGEVAVSLMRSIPFKSRVQLQGAPPGAEKEVIQFKSIPFMTKVALFPNKPVVIFEDEEGSISLKLSNLEKP